MLVGGKSTNVRESRSFRVASAMWKPYKIPLTQNTDEFVIFSSDINLCRTAWVTLLACTRLHVCSFENVLLRDVYLITWFVFLFNLLNFLNSNVGSIIKDIGITFILKNIHVTSSLIPSAPLPEKIYADMIYHSKRNINIIVLQLVIMTIWLSYHRQFYI